MNYFYNNLSQSMVCSRNDNWLVFYKYFFPTMISSSLHDNDLVAQRNGIDRKIFLKGGKVIGIDEKIRNKAYGDILLEESSSIKSPGWIEKPLWCDYIAYSIPSVNKCYLLPFIQLQAAWLSNKNEWKSKYFKIEAVNEGYVTTSWAIPITVLYRAIADKLIKSI